MHGRRVHLDNKCLLRREHARTRTMYGVLCVFHVEEGIFFSSALDAKIQSAPRPCPRHHLSTDDLSTPPSLYKPRSSLFSSSDFLCTLAGSGLLLQLTHIINWGGRKEERKEKEKMAKETRGLPKPAAAAGAADDGYHYSLDPVSPC